MDYDPEYLLSAAVNDPAMPVKDIERIARRLMESAAAVTRTMTGTDPHSHADIRQSRWGRTEQSS